MKPGELRALPRQELLAQIQEMRRRMYDNRSQKQGDHFNTMTIKNLRRDVARINTILREKEIAEMGENRLSRKSREARKKGPAGVPTPRLRLRFKPARRVK